MLLVQAIEKQEEGSQRMARVGSEPSCSKLTPLSFLSQAYFLLQYGGTQILTTVGMLFLFILNVKNMVCGLQFWLL